MTRHATCRPIHAKHACLCAVRHACPLTCARMQGGGIAYGTKEGRLRVLRHAATAGRGLPGRAMEGESSARSLADELIEADQLAAAQVASSDED